MCINFSSEVANVYEGYDFYFALPPFALHTMSGRELLFFGQKVTHEIMFLTLMQEKPSFLLSWKS